MYIELIYFFGSLEAQTTPNNELNTQFQTLGVKKINMTSLLVRKLHAKQLLHLLIIDVLRTKTTDSKSAVKNVL